MRDTTDRLLDHLARQPRRQFKAKELARSLRVPPKKYRQFRDLLRTLAQQGKIAKLSRNQYGSVRQTSTLSGTLHVKTQGYGFLITGEGQEDVFVSQKNMATALNGDVVKVQLFARPTGMKPEGRVVEIISRARRNIVGSLKKGKYFFFVKPDDNKLLRDIYIPSENLNGAKPGQKVAVVIESWEDELQNPEGRIVKILGYPGEPGVDVLSVAFAFDLPPAFPPEVERQAESLGLDITPGIVSQRLDLRDQVTFTIDPEDAKDFDDAVSLRRLRNGNYELGVHIADVSHFVPESSPIDREALARGTSVYLVDRVVPMLPERLSNEICSLKPDTDRLTFSCIMEVTPRGRVVKYKIVESIIHSQQRFNYEEAQAILDGRHSSDAGLDRILADMNHLAQILHRRRRRNGSLDFDTPEADIILDKDGHPIEIKRKVRLASHRLIEEFMLLANQTVARHVSLALARQRKRPPFIYRIHEKPDALKIKEFASFVKALGFKFDHQQTITSKSLNQFLEEIRDEPEADIIEIVMLRSMMKAKYSLANSGHFGLAFKHYTHFTSPIRRYPDLVVHRLLKTYATGYKPELREVYERKLERISQKANERELVAQEAERASTKLKQTEYMKQHLGEEFDGLISGVVSFGIFVEIPQYLVEGLVHISELDEDFYIYDEKLHRLKGQNSGRIYRLGDPVRVKLVNVKIDERLLDFMLVKKERRRRRKKTKRVALNRRRKN